MLHTLRNWLLHVRGVRAVGYLLLAVLLTCFNLVLCARVLAPGRTAVFLFSLILPGLLLVLIVVNEIARRRLRSFPIELSVCMAVVVLGVVFSIVFPPFSIPDESSHFRAAYSLANAILFRGPEAVMRPDDLFFYESIRSPGGQISDEYYHVLAESFTLLIPDASLVRTDQIAVFSLPGMKTPQVYLASALGLALAQLIGLGTLPAIYLARFFNLMFFAVLLFFAMRIIPQGKRIIAVVALLPMTLQQVASLSYDAGVLGMSFLLVALLLRAILEDGPLLKKELIAIFVIAVLLAPCKVVYTLILVLALFVPAASFKNSKQAIIFKVLLFSCSLAYILIARSGGIASLASTQAPEEGMRGYAISSIFEHPGWFLNMVVTTIYAKGDFDLFTTLGYSLGSFQDGLISPFWCMVPFIIILLFAAIRVEGERQLSAGLRAVMIVVFFAVTFFTAIAMFLDFTKIGSEVIEGVQGRYFLPVLPLLLFGIQGKNIVAKENRAYALLYCEAMMSAYIVCINFSTILSL